MWKYVRNRSYNSDALDKYFRPVQIKFQQFQVQLSKIFQVLIIHFQIHLTTIVDSKFIFVRNL